jgi:hypothetical protein
MRRLPHQGARHSTFDHGDASDGVFLLLRGCLGMASTSSTTCSFFLWVEQSSLRMISPLFSLSLACGWPLGRMALSLSTNGSASTYLRLHHLHAQKMGGGPEPTLEWARPVGLGRPVQAHFGPVRSPLRTCGSSWHVALCPLQLHHFDYVILKSKMEGLLTWSSVFYASILEDVPM